MSLSLIALLVGGAAPAMAAEPEYAALDCLRRSVILSDVTFVELGDPIKLPRVIGRIENNLSWDITGFRFDYQVEDTATGAVWRNMQAGTGELDPPLAPGESRDFNIYSNYYPAEDIKTIKLTPEMWDVTDLDGREIIDDHRSVTPISYQLSRSERTCP